MRALQKISIVVTLCTCWIWTATVFAAADTLVVKTAGGKIGPGAAKAWNSAGGVVQFTLGAGVDGAAWANALSERLAGAWAARGKAPPLHTASERAIRRRRSK